MEVLVYQNSWLSKIDCYFFTIEPIIFKVDGTIESHT